jgi:hypothetical protein
MVNISRNPALAFRLSSPIIVADLVDPDGSARRNSSVPLVALSLRDPMSGCRETFPARQTELIVGLVRLPVREAMVWIALR